MRRDKKLSTSLLLFELFFLLLFFAFFMFIYVNVKSHLNKDVLIHQKASFSYLLSQIDYHITTEKEKFAMILQIEDSINIQEIKFIDDFYMVSAKGHIKKVIKRSDKFEFHKGYDVSRNQEVLIADNFSNNQIYVYGPYFSTLTGEDEISYISRIHNKLYIANLNIKTIRGFINRIQKDEDSVVLFSTKEGLILLNTCHKYPCDKYKRANITMQGGRIDLEKTPYYHSIEYNNNLGVYVHLLSSIKENLQIIKVYLGLMYIFIFIIVFFSISRLYIQRKRILVYMLDVIQVVGNWNTDKELKLPRAKFQELNKLREFFMQLSNRIRLELAEEKRIKNYYDNIFNTSPNIMISTDVGGVITMINTAGQEFFGVKHKQNKIAKLIEFTDDEKKVIDNVKNETVEFEHITEKMIKNDDEQKVFEILIYRLTEDSKASGLVFNLVDIGERKIIEEQLIQSEKMESVGLLAGGFAHDFNNILTVIMGNIDFYKYAKTEKKQLEIIAEVSNAVDKATNLVRQIQMFSQRKMFGIDVFGVETAIKNIMLKLSDSISSNILVKYNFQDTHGIGIIANKRHLEKVIISLIDNACEAIGDRENGQIKISTEKIFLDIKIVSRLKLQNPGDYVKICIVDNGGGIDETIKDKIFDPFFSTKSERITEKGLGLSLAIVRRTVRKMQGIIDVANVDDGVVFCLYFKVVE